MWLVAASSRWPWLSVPVFAVMLAALVVVLRAVVAARADWVSRMLLGITAGVYAGWSTAAVWVNAASLLPQAGIDPDGTASVVLQRLAVAGAGLAAAAGARALHGQAAYVLTAGWALVGVALSAARADVRPLLLTAVVALVGVTAATVATRVPAARAA